MTCPIHPNTMCVCHTQTAAAAVPQWWIGQAAYPGTYAGLGQWLPTTTSVEPTAEQRRIAALEGDVEALTNAIRAQGNLRGDLERMDKLLSEIKKRVL